MHSCKKLILCNSHFLIIQNSTAQSRNREHISLLSKFIISHLLKRKNPTKISLHRVKVSIGKGKEPKRQRTSSVADGGETAVLVPVILEVIQVQVALGTIPVQVWNVAVAVRIPPDINTQNTTYATAHRSKKLSQG